MDTNGRDARLALITSRQQGAFTFGQALEQGFPRATISRRLASGAWARVHPGVFELAGCPSTRDGDLWRAVLAAGPATRVTHESAALLHGAERLPAWPITLTGPHRWHHDLRGVFVHQIDDLTPAWCVRRRGLVVSSAARCVVELGATQPESVVGAVADDLVANRSTTLAGIAAAFAAVVRPGKPGMLTVSRVLEERSDGKPAPRSELERALFGALRAGGLPDPERQFRLPGQPRDLPGGLVDGAYPDAQIVLEADGRRWHDRVRAARQDRERDARAARLGWQTLRFVHEQIVGNPAEVCAVVAETRQVRLALLQRTAEPAAA